MNFVYPTLLQSANNVQSYSWFDIKERKNPLKIERKYVKFKYKYKDTFKYELFLTKEQKTKLLLWLDDCIDVYNLTNQYIKNNHLTENDVNYYKLRKTLNNNLYNICNKNGMRKHTADYALKHCVEMYKSAFTNNGDKEFNIKDLDKSRRRKNLVIEPANFKCTNEVNTFFNLGHIESSFEFRNIKRNSTLQYDSHKNSFIIITPIDKENIKELKKYNKCGIDIGVRTFLTTYSQDASYEIGTNNNKMIDNLNNRLDKIKSNHDKKIINEKKYKYIYTKYSDKLENKIKDLHNKAANFLLKNYDIINIGKVSTKSMVSNLTGNLQAITKRRLYALSHYKFRMKLIQMAEKFKTTVNEINEYMTSKKCHNCENLKNDLGSNKIYNCEKCGLNIDRDINAAINIFNIGS